MSQIKVKALKSFDHGDMSLKEGKTYGLGAADARSFANVGLVELAGEEKPDPVVKNDTK